jgi:hypothetical protein
MTNWANYGKWRHGKKRKEILDNLITLPEDVPDEIMNPILEDVARQVENYENKVMNKEVKKCVLEILDVLYDKPGFDYWWHNLSKEYEEEITAELEQIVKRRFEKIKNEQSR